MEVETAFAKKILEDTTEEYNRRYGFEVKDENTENL